MRLKTWCNVACLGDEPEWRVNHHIAYPRRTETWCADLPSTHAHAVSEKVRVLWQRWAGKYWGNMRLYIVYNQADSYSPALVVLRAGLLASWPGRHGHSPSHLTESTFPDKQPWKSSLHWKSGNKHIIFSVRDRVKHCFGKYLMRRTPVGLVVGFRCFNSVCILCSRVICYQTICYQIMDQKNGSVLKTRPCLDESECIRYRISICEKHN